MDRRTFHRCATGALVLLIGATASAASQPAPGASRERRAPIAVLDTSARPRAAAPGGADIERLVTESERQARSIRWLWVGHFVWFVFAASTMTWRLVMSEPASRATKEVRAGARPVEMTTWNNRDDRLLGSFTRLEERVRMLEGLADATHARSATQRSAEAAPPPPAPATAAPAAAATTPRAESVWYAEAPDRDGTFHEVHFTLNKGPLSLYEFNAVNPSKAPAASVTLCKETDVLRRAILNADSLLRPACEYGETPGPQHNQIVVIEAGHAERGDHGWQMRRKIAISFS